VNLVSFLSFSADKGRMARGVLPSKRCAAGGERQTFLIVSVTRPPRVTAPRNSAKAAMIHACFRVKTFDPTEVAKPENEEKERKKKKKEKTFLD